MANDYRQFSCERGITATKNVMFSKTADNCVVAFNKDLIAEASTNVICIISVIIKYSGYYDTVTQYSPKSL